MSLPAATEVNEQGLALMHIDEKNDHRIDR